MVMVSTMAVIVPIFLTEIITALEVGLKRTCSIIRLSLTESALSPSTSITLRKSSIAERPGKSIAVPTTVTIATIISAPIIWLMALRRLVIFLSIKK